MDCRSGILAFMNNALLNRVYGDEHTQHERRRSCHVSILYYSLDIGGVSREITSHCRHFVEKGWRVTVLLMRSSAEVARPLPSGVEVRTLDLDAPVKGVLARRRRTLRAVQRLRRELRELKPDILISHEAGANVIAVPAAKFAGVPVVVCEHVDRGIAPRLLKGVTRVLYPLADSLVTVSNGLDQDFQWLAKTKRRVIHNPAPIGWPDPPPFSSREPIVVGIGRLYDQKQFDVLIRAFNEIADQHPEWRLEIWGEGPKRAELEKLIGALSRCDRIKLCGSTDNVSRVLERASVLGLTSRYEGFGNVLVEALVMGVPAVTFDCRHGPREIVRHGVDGLVVRSGDVDGFAMALGRLVGDEGLRRRAGSRAIEARQRFCPEVALEKWANVVTDFAR